LLRAIVRLRRRVQHQLLRPDRRHLHPLVREALRRRKLRLRQRSLLVRMVQRPAPLLRPLRPLRKLDRTKLWPELRPLRLWRLRRVWRDLWPRPWPRIRRRRRCVLLVPPAHAQLAKHRRRHAAASQIRQIDNVRHDDRPSANQSLHPTTRRSHPAARRKDRPTALAAA
jgi:hypothetical protein